MNDRQTKEFDATKECNFAIAPPGIGRFRVSAFVQQGAVGCVIRLINAKIPTFEELDLPPILKEVVLSKRGLVIIVGGTGSGKSTSLAAMVGYRNEKTRGHIVTIEDPVEYVHQHKGCVITHREVGRRHRLLARRAQEHPAPGAGRDPDRRDPRPRDDGVRHPVRRDRPPGAGDAARQQRQPGARPHHQLLPRRAARAAADGPVAEHPRAGLAAADSARVRRRPHRRDGNHAQLAADPGPDLQGRGGQDQGSHVALDAPRHEDLRPVAVRAVRDRLHLLRGCAAQRGLQERAAPAHQAREQARSTRTIDDGGALQHRRGSSRARVCERSQGPDCRRRDRRCACRQDRSRGADASPAPSDAQHQAAVQADGGEEGLGPVLHLQRAHQDQDRGPDPAGQQAGADPGDGAPDRLRADERRSSASTSSGSCEIDFAISEPGLGRFRVNVFMQRGYPAMVLRYITADMPRLEHARACRTS